MSAELIGISRDMLIPKSKINNKMDTYSNRARKQKHTAEAKSMWGRVRETHRLSARWQQSQHVMQKDKAELSRGSGKNNAKF